MIKELVEEDRSYRRFYGDYEMTREQLLELVDLARLTPSAANRQALRYAISCDKKMNGKLFECLRWAAYLPDWNGPIASEHPSGYIVFAQRSDYKMVNPADAGIAAQTILLGAVDMGLGGCIVASVDRAKIKEIMGLAEDIEILFVIALGKPKEKVVIDEMKAGDSVKYYRDENEVHHVPKMKLEDILL